MRLNLTRVVVRLTALAFAAAPAAQTCVAQGLTLAADGDRLGDPWTITIVGSPGAPGLIGVDTGGGPTPTPIGTLCLDLSSAFFTIPFGLDGSGFFQATGNLPLASVWDGATLHLQAAAIDATQPGGLALSNGDQMALRAPRVFLFDAGFADPLGSSVPAALASVNAMTNTVDWTQTLTSPGVQAVHRREDGLLVALMTDGSIELIDDTTGASAGGGALPALAGPATQLLAPTDAAGIVLALYVGTPPSPFTTGAPGAVAAVLLPGLAVGTTISLSSGNPTEFFPVPDTAVAWLRDGSRVIGVNWGTGSELFTTDLGSANGSIADGLVHNAQLVTLMAGLPATPFSPAQPGAIAGVDATTGVLLPTSPAVLTSITATGVELRVGPGSGGESYMALFPVVSEIVEIDPANLALRNLAVGVPGIDHLELSTGASEWLLLESGYPGDPFGGPPLPGNVYTLDPSSLVITQRAALPAESHGGLATLDSVLLRRAYVTSRAVLYVLATDPTPTGAVLATIPIPTAASSWAMIAD